MYYLHEHGPVTVCQFPCLSDNYGFLLLHQDSGTCAAIDTPDAAAISRAAEAQDWTLTHIWNTHWHPDHTGGNEALKEQWGCTVIGPAAENGRIPAADTLVKDQDVVTLGEVEAQVIATPGHTTGHIIYYLEEAGIAFVGDTLFALGCGRLFEGTPQMMWTSLLKLRALPADTTVFCAHEYTQANAKFALSIEPENAALQERCGEINDLRAANNPTVPTTIGLEKSTNPFLRADKPSVQRQLNMVDASEIDVFAEIRLRKDQF